MSWKSSDFSRFQIWPNFPPLKMVAPAGQSSHRLPAPNGPRVTQTFNLRKEIFWMRKKYFKSIDENSYSKGKYRWRNPRNAVGRLEEIQLTVDRWREAWVKANGCQSAASIDQTWASLRYCMPSQVPPRASIGISTFPPFFPFWKYGRKNQRNTLDTYMSRKTFRPPSARNKLNEWLNESKI